MDGSCPNCGSARPNVLKVVKINGTGLYRYTFHCLNPSCGCTFDEMKRQAREKNSIRSALKRKTA